MKKITTWLTFLLWIQWNVICAKSPNVLFLAVDDLRPLLGCYGEKQIETPNIDALAKQSLQFNKAFCNVAVCGASRANLMNGILPTPKRFVAYTSEAQIDVPHAKTLPQVFKEAGYITVANGKVFHNKKDTQARSWSQPVWQPDLSGLHSLDPDTTKFLSKKKKRGRIYELPDVSDEAYGDGLIAEKTIEDLKRLSQKEPPFFLACGFKKPHMPFYAPKKYWDLYDRDQLKLAKDRTFPKGAPSDLKGSGEFRSYHLADFEVNSEAWHRMMIHGYYACVSYIDALVGQVLETLDELNLSKETIVVLWGDHGFHLGEHNFWGKHNTMIPSMQIPLLIKVPGRMGEEVEEFVETGDIFPTLCHLVGLEIPQSVQGKVMGSLNESFSSSKRDHAYGRYRQGDVIIRKNFSYTRYLSGAEMLSHLEEDMGENENVAGIEKYEETLKEMRLILNQRMEAASLYAP